MKENIDDCIVQPISSIYLSYVIRQKIFIYLFIYLFTLFNFAKKVNGKVVVGLRTFQVYCILYCYHKMPYSNGQYSIYFSNSYWAICLCAGISIL
jgi:hypothetical protein